MPRNRIGDRQNRSPRLPAHPLIQIQRALGARAGGRFIQAMLTVSQPGDQHEQEADRMADQVMRMPDQTAPADRGGRRFTADFPSSTYVRSVRGRRNPAGADAGGNERRGGGRNPPGQRSRRTGSTSRVGQYMRRSTDCAVPANHCPNQCAHFLSRGSGVISDKCGCMPMRKRQSQQGR